MIVLDRGRVTDGIPASKQVSLKKGESQDDLLFRYAHGYKSKACSSTFWYSRPLSLGSKWDSFVWLQVDFVHRRFTSGMPSKKRRKGESSEEEGSQDQGETQFEPHESDNSEIFWDVKCILNEKPGFYFVDWDGIDPATGEPWPPSWVTKTDCTDDLIQEWKAAKRKKKEEAKAAKFAKSSTYALYLSSEAVHIVLSSFTQM